jgi:hypothetical protein
MEKMDQEIGEETPETLTLSKCPACGEETYQTIFAKVTLANSTEEYNACPKCLSKMQRTEAHEDSQPAEIIPNEQADSDIAKNEKCQKEEPASDLNCPYQFGYLRKQERNLPIPEECLICKKMIECRI